MTEYQTIVADPPWQFGDMLPPSRYSDTRGAALNYSTLSLRQLKELDLPLLASNSRLFLWRVASMQQEALDVMRAWGFTLKTELVWYKMTNPSTPGAESKPWFGMGRTVRASHETCLIGVRGRPAVLSHSVRSVFAARYTRHSGKPDEFYDIVEQLSPGPYVELFARRQRANWTCSGDEVPSLPLREEVVS